MISYIRCYSLVGLRSLRASSALSTGVFPYFTKCSAVRTGSMSLISRAPVIGSSLGLLSRQDQQKEIRPLFASTCYGFRTARSRSTKYRRWKKVGSRLSSMATANCSVSRI